MARTRTTRRNYSGTNAPAPDLLPRDGGDFIDRTIATWQKHTSRQLTREDGREIIENMTGFFRILDEWDRAGRVAPDRTRRPLVGAKPLQKTL